MAAKKDIIRMVNSIWLAEARGMIGSGVKKADITIGEKIIEEELVSLIEGVDLTFHEDKEHPWGMTFKDANGERKYDAKEKVERIEREKEERYNKFKEFMNEIEQGVPVIVGGEIKRAVEEKERRRLEKVYQGHSIKVDYRYAEAIQINEEAMKRTKEEKKEKIGRYIAEKVGENPREYWSKKILMGEETWEIMSDGKRNKDERTLYGIDVIIVKDYPNMIAVSDIKEIVEDTEELFH